MHMPLLKIPLFVCLLVCLFVCKIFDNHTAVFPVKFGRAVPHYKMLLVMKAERLKLISKLLKVSSFTSCLSVGKMVTVKGTWQNLQNFTLLEKGGQC